MKLTKAFTACVLGLAVVVGARTALAQSAHPWMDAKLLADAKKEDGFTLYGSINEEEALPLLKLFETATGIKTEYVRNSDTGLMARIQVATEASPCQDARASQPCSIAVLAMSSASSLPTMLHAKRTSMGRAAANSSHHA